MKYSLIISFILVSIWGYGQTISPANPSAGVNTVVTVSTLPSTESTYMIAYPSGIPAGADVRVMLSWGGVGENSGQEMTQVTWNKFVSVGYNAVAGTTNPGPWDMKQRKSDGTYIYWCIMGIPDYGSTPVTNQAKAIDAVIDFFATKGLDTSDATKFYSIQLSAGSRRFWCYRGNKSTQVVSYTSKHYYKFNRTITMSPIAISVSSDADVNAITSAIPGRHAVFYDINDGTTNKVDAVNLYNKINAASTKRKDSTAGAGNTHSGKTWDSASSYINFDKTPAVGVRSSQTSIITWLSEPNAGTAPVPPVADAGADHSIQLPITQVTLGGGPVGMATYLWQQISGPAPSSIFSPTSATTIAKELVEGTYVFRLTVTATNSLQDTDDVIVIVTPEAEGVIILRRHKVKKV